MRGLVETLGEASLNEAKMLEFPIVITLYRHDSDGELSLATIACDKSYFTEESLEKSARTNNKPLEFIPGKEDAFWEMIGNDEYPFANMMSFEWKNNLSFAYSRRYNVRVYLETEGELYRDISMRKNDIRELETELEYMQKIVKMA